MKVRKEIYNGTDAEPIQVIEPEYTQDDILEYLRKFRDEKIYSGITVNGVTIETDDLTQQRIMAARIVAKEDANYTVNWKASGTFVALNAAQIIAISDAVRLHVQKCFDAEKTATDNIDNYGTPDEVKTAFDNAYNA